jgi:hypothetical protein
LTGNEGTRHNVGGRFRRFHRGDEEAADGLTTAIDVELGAIDDPLVKTACNHDEAPLIVGLPDGGLELPADQARLLIGSEGHQFRRDFFEAVAIDLCGGHGTLELGQFDFRLLDLGADLDHLLLDGFDSGDVLDEHFRLVEIRLGSFEGALLGLVVRVGLRDLVVDIDLFCLQGLGFRGESLDRLLKHRDLVVGLFEARLTLGQELFLSLDRCAFGLVRAPVFEAEIGRAGQDNGCND